MNHNYKDMMSQQPLPDQHGDFFRMVQTPPFGRSREQAWERLEARLTAQSSGRVVPFIRLRTVAAAAALLALAMGTVLLMRLYTVTETSGEGQQISCNLPDGSLAELNAGSTLSYQPWWWRFSRTLQLDGEAYFEAEKGRTFRVLSANGTTEVLGTSFTVYARPDEYRVDCYTGKVRVASPSGEKTVLIPGHSATIASDGSIRVSVTLTDEPQAPWKQGMFSFSARPLRLVLDEIQRQYDVTVIFESGNEFLFTGYFSKELPVQEALEVVCKPFGLTFTQRTDRVYEITPN